MATKSVAGGYNWRRVLVDLIRKNRAQIDALLQLMEVAATPETAKLIRGLIDDNLEIIEMLYQLHAYDNTGGNGEEES